MGIITSGRPMVVVRAVTGETINVQARQIWLDVDHLGIRALRFDCGDAAKGALTEWSGDEVQAEMTLDGREFTATGRLRISDGSFQVERQQPLSGELAQTRANHPGT